MSNDWGGLSQGFRTRTSERLESQHVHPHIVIPGGALALHAQAAHDRGGRVQADEVADDFLEQGKVLRRVVLADGTAILAHGDVENPVKPVFDTSMGTHGLGQFFRCQHPGSDVVALF